MIHAFRTMLLLACAMLLHLALAPSAPAADSHSSEKLTSLNHAGLEAYRNHDYAAAESSFKTALDEAYAGNDQSWVGTILSNLSAVYSAQGKTSDADRLSLEAESIKNKVAGITAKPKLAAPQRDTFTAGTLSSDPPWKSLSGYVSETERFNRASTKRPVLAGKLPLQSQAAVIDSSVFPSRANNGTGSGGIEWGPWAPPARLPPPEAFVPTPTAGGFPPPQGFGHRRFQPPPPGPGACGPCQDRDGVMVMIRVQGYGGIIGPGGNLGGPGLLKLFDFGGTFGE